MDADIDFILAQAYFADYNIPETQAIKIWHSLEALPQNQEVQLFEHEFKEKYSFFEDCDLYCHKDCFSLKKEVLFPVLE